MRFAGRHRAAIFASFVVAMSSGVFAEPQGGIERVAWLHGCWRTSAPAPSTVAGSAPTVVEEQWMAPGGGTMIGMGRTVRAGRTTEYELVVLKEQDGRLAYEAHPSGQPPAVFLSKEITDTSVVFENPEHDFPQRVGYRRSGSALAAWVEGTVKGRERRVDFAYTRVACDER